MEAQVGKLVFTLLLAGAWLLAPPAPPSLPLVVDVRPATGEHVVLRINGGDSVRSADPRVGFVLSLKREAAGVSREFEARGQRAVIRVRGGEVSVDAETMTMREVRPP
jgi:hypothetical protein